MEEDRHKQMLSDQSSKGFFTLKKDVVVVILSNTIPKRYFVPTAVSMSQELILKDIKEDVLNITSGTNNLTKAITIFL